MGTDGPSIDASLLNGEGERDGGAIGKERKKVMGKVRFMHYFLVLEG